MNNNSFDLSEIIKEYTDTAEKKRERFSCFDLQEHQDKEALRKKHLFESKILYLKYFGSYVKASVANALKDGKMQTFVQVPECLWLSRWSEQEIIVGDDISIENPLYEIQTSFNDQGYKVYFLSNKDEDGQYDWSRLEISWYKK